MRSVLSSLLSRARDLGIIDEITEDNGSLVLTSGTKKLSIEEQTSADGVSYLLWSSAKPDTIYEIVGQKAEPLAGRLVCQFFMGLTSGRFMGRTYTNALFVPNELTEEGLIMQSADGTKYLLTSSDAGGNVANITLDFYNLVYDTNGEHWVMSLPGLFARDNSKIGVVRSSLEATNSVDSLIRQLPSSIETLSVCPRSDNIPVMGTSIQSGVVITSSDTTKLVDMNKTLNTFMFGTDTPGYIAPQAIESTVNHQDLSKEILKSDHFKVKAMENGALQINCMRRVGTRDVYSSFTAMANMFKAEEYIKPAGVTLRQLKAGVDLSGVSEAEKFKSFLVSSAKFQVLDAPEIKRSLVSQGLVGEQAQKRLLDLGFDTSLGILSTVRQIGVDAVFQA